MIIQQLSEKVYEKYQKISALYLHDLDIKFVYLFQNYTKHQCVLLRKRAPTLKKIISLKRYDMF